MDKKRSLFEGILALSPFLVPAGLGISAVGILRPAFEGTVVIVLVTAVLIVVSTMAFLLLHNRRPSPGQNWRKAASRPSRITAHVARDEARKE
jgi:hypothetical protein